MGAHGWEVRVAGEMHIRAFQLEGSLSDVSLTQGPQLALVTKSEDQRLCGYVGVRAELMYVSFYLLFVNRPMKM